MYFIIFKQYFKFLKVHILYNVSYPSTTSTLQLHHVIPLPSTKCILTAESVLAGGWAQRGKTSESSEKYLLSWGLTSLWSTSVPVVIPVIAVLFVV